jgi:hypothetical protein
MIILIVLPTLDRYKTSGYVTRIVIKGGLSEKDTGWTYLVNLLHTVPLMIQTSDAVRIDNPRAWG